MIVIKINARPKAKARPRVTKKDFTYTPKETKEFEDLIREEARKIMKGKKILTNPVNIKISFRFKPAKCYFNTKFKKDNIEIINGLYNIPMLQKPDIDNLAKSILDPLNKVVYEDDKQVVGLYTEKLYAEKDEIIIEVDSLGLDNNGYLYHR